MLRVGVVGAGIMGLSAAVNVQKAIPTAKVTIVADQFGQMTTSDGAGGIFRLCLTDFPENLRDMVRQWGRDSWQFFTGLATSPLASETGQALVPGLVVNSSQQDVAYELMREVTYDFKKVSPTEMTKRKIDPKYKYGYSMTTVITQCPKYMPWLLKQFRDAGGDVQHRTLHSIKELYGEFDVVVNCCGLRAKELVGDTSVYPIKGHLLKMYAPWMKEFFFAGSDSVYFVPHDNYLLIGGIREKYNGSLVPEPKDRDLMLSRAEHLFPQLKGAKMLGEWVGLRPGRDDIRFGLERVQIGDGGNILPVVHNYGHAGHGITLSWGAGLAAAKLVREFSSTFKSNL